MTQRGDVVVIEFPCVDGGRGKNRPAVVVQADENNRRLSNTIVVMVSGNTRLAGKVTTQVLVDPSFSQGLDARLHGLSVIKCENVFTVRQQDILRTIGRLSHGLMTAVDDSLRASLGLAPG